MGNMFYDINFKNGTHFLFYIQIDRLGVWHWGIKITLLNPMQKERICNYSIKEFQALY